MTIPLDCGHAGESGQPRACTHLLTDRALSYYRRFSGKGLDHDLVCGACQNISNSDLRTICANCITAIEDDGDYEGFVGQPEIRIRDSTLRFRHRVVNRPFTDEMRDIQPIEGEDRQLWMILTTSRRLLQLDLDAGSVVEVGKLPTVAAELDSLHLSPDGNMVAVVQRRGERGLVFDLTSRSVTMQLDRGTYHVGHCNFPVAFCVVDERLVLVHGTAWNRLEVSDPRTGQTLTERPIPAPREGHFLDYFHCGLLASPNHEYLAEDGWVWHPCGVVRTWNLHRWLHSNSWESEDGESRKGLCSRNYFWDGPMCWLDNHRLAVWGVGDDEEYMVPAVRIFDVTTGKEERWFAGPKGKLFFDEYLFSCDPAEGTTVWDIASGEQLLHDPDLRPTHYLRSARTFLTVLPDGQFRLSKLVGQPLVTNWRMENVLAIAQGILAEKSFSDLPVLADALEEAGCSDANILEHCRNPGPHGHECWVVDRLLGG